MPPDPRKADFTLLALALLAILFSVWYVATHPLPQLVKDVEAQTVEPTHSEIKMYAVKESFEATVTGYNSVPEQTDHTPCLAASGANICVLHAAGVATCAVNRLPFGSWIFVEGFGRCRVEDRTAQKYNQRVDIYFGGRDRIQDARDWGKQRRRIYVIEN